jgi:tRNA threonylcarbamoyladenosine biosynthesis protein TsaB
MIVLAIESATEVAGVALADDRGVLSVAGVSRGRRHAESLAPAIEFVCRRAGVALAEVAVVAVDVGPGLFTGLRVGVATAKALAFALRILVVSATSLDVLAHAVASSGVDPGRLLVPVVDARRGEVFVGWFRAQPQEAVQVGSDARLTPEGLGRALRDVSDPYVLAGDGALRYRAELGDLPGATLARATLAHPPVAVLATLGVARATAGECGDHASVAPRYLRDADTRIHFEQRPRPAAAEA